VEHYEKNWPDVRDAIMANANRYHIDDEAKDALREALIGHKKGLYRSVVRHLFAEIERVARNELYKGALGTIRTQELFADLIGKLVLGGTVFLGSRS
jgi:hypothetical protein